MTETFENPMGTDGFAFLEFSSPDSTKLIQEFEQLGFVEVGTHRSYSVRHFQQGDIHFLVNEDASTFADDFKQKHGPCVSGMGFRVQNAQEAYQRAIELGAKAYEGNEGHPVFGADCPAIYGIGDSLLYFVDTARAETQIYEENFNATAEAPATTGVGLLAIDHVTHNVFQGRMDHWAEFYERLFNFREIRFFDIRGQVTGLVSRAMSSPCGKIRIPLNEATEDASQIAEYLRDYNGEGIQHIALSTDTIYTAIEEMKERKIRFLDVPDTYYELLDGRVSGHGEDVPRLQKNKILLDGNVEKGLGTLLQIFTENMLGPVFFEIIQRKGNQGFGEGNFQALFEAIERDQIARGVLKSEKEEG